MAHYELHAWCLLVLAWVFVPSTPGPVFTMPLLRSDGSAPSHVWRRSSAHHVYGVEDCGGDFAGGVVFGTLLPELKITLAGW